MNAFQVQQVPNKEKPRSITAIGRRLCYQVSVCGYILYTNTLRLLMQWNSRLGLPRLA